VGKRRPGPVTRRLLRTPTLVYRVGLGRVLGRRFLMITHVGRRTGRQYRTVLEVVRLLPASHEYVVLAGFGHWADWLQNVLVGGGREVLVGHDRFSPVVRQVAHDEAVAALADYERRNRLIAPVVRRVLSWLVGWRYTGTEVERATLVDQVPMVALRPADLAPG
jgi:deazaflavin-dependent oxidoreductase (nitroreductase family)